MKNSKLAERLISGEILKIAGAVNAMIKNGEMVNHFTVGDFNTNYYTIPATLKKCERGITNLRIAVSQLSF